MVSEPELSIFVCRFEYQEFCDTKVMDDRAFEIIVAAIDRGDALRLCRTKLNEIALGPDPLGEVNVFLCSTLQLPSSATAHGVMIHLHSREFGSLDALPLQDQRGAAVHLNEGGRYDNAGERTIPAFWSGVEAFRNRWKLYWCYPDERYHGHGWFVVAQSDDSALEFCYGASTLEFEEDEEGDEGHEPTIQGAEPICVVPAAASLSLAAPERPAMTLLQACGAEVLPDSLTRPLQAVRIQGHVFLLLDQAMRWARPRTSGAADAN